MPTVPMKLRAVVGSFLHALRHGSPLVYSDSRLHPHLRTSFSALIITLLLSVLATPVNADEQNSVNRAINGDSESKKNTPTITFDIAPSLLSEAILAFSEQSDTTVIAPAHALEGKTSKGLSGSWTKKQAIEELLKGSDLAFSFTENGNIRISPSQPAPIPTLLTRKTVSPKHVEEIIVSSGRRPQLQQKYAGTISAFSMHDMEKLGAGQDFQSIQIGVPGMQISLNEGFQEIFVRGIGTQDNSVSSDQPTALHYNNAYVPKLRGLGPLMFDIESVEVHHGPQGTLRGRNATAGTINIQSKMPKLNETYTELSIEMGSFDLLTKQAMLNLPIVTDKLGLRFAYQSRDHDAYYSNARNDHDSIEPATGAGSEDENAWRVSISWEPGDYASTHLVVDRSTARGTGFPGNYAGQTFSQGLRIDDLEDPWKQFFQTSGKVDTDIESAVLTQIFYAPQLTTELILSYRTHDSLTVNPRRPFQHGFVNDYVQSADDISVWEFDNYNTNWIADSSTAKTAELRFSSREADSAFYWTAGIYAFDESAAELRWDISDASALVQDNLGGPDFAVADATSVSIYADMTFNLSDDWRVISGIRFTNEKKQSERWDAKLDFTGIADSLDLDNDGDTTELLTADSELAALVRLGTPGFRIENTDNLRAMDPNSYGSAYDFLQSLVGSFGERDNLHLLLENSPNHGTINTIAPGGVARTDFDDNFVNWRLGMEHDLSSTHMLYGTISTGARSGGINPPYYVGEQFVNSTFDKEEITAFELGSKNQYQWLNQPTQLNVSLFYYLYKKQIFQIGVFSNNDHLMADDSNVSADLRQINVNIGDSRAFGITTDLDMNIGDHWLLGWNMLLMKTEITDGETVDGRQSPQRVDNDGDGEEEFVLPPTIDLKGNDLINSPQLSTNLHLGQEFKISQQRSWNWTVSLNYKSSFHATPFENKGYDFQGNRIPLAEMELCCDTQYADANGDGETEIGDGRFFNDKTGDSLIVNAHIGITFGKESQHQIQLYGHNLTEEAYPQKQIINAAVNIVFLNNPRTFGAKLSTKF